MKEEVKKVVLAYSGGLDTSVIVRWLVDTYGCEVVAFVADVGQEEELTGLLARSQAELGNGKDTPKNRAGFLNVMK